MSAIYGLVGEADLSLLAAMGARLRHRGGEASESSPGPGVFLGQRASRLSELPAAPATAVADASLFDAEPGEPAGGPSGVLRGGAAARCIQHAYESRGLEGLGDLNGDFAAAFWDERRSGLVLVRDPLGVRVFYTWQGPRCFAFASEYKALLALEEVEAVPDLAALQHLQRTKYLPPDRTLLRGIRPAPAGSLLEVVPGTPPRGRRYWTLARGVERTSRPRAEADLRRLFLAAVARRTAGDAATGAELSGGIDSAAVVAAIRQADPGRPIRTYTIGAGPHDPEILGAREVAEALGTDHHEVLADPGCIHEALPDVVWHLEDPIGRTETVLYHRLVEIAARDGEVLLGGFASDALYGGMPRHKLVKLMQLAPPLRGPLEEFYRYTQYSEPPRSPLSRLATRLLFGAGELPAPRILEVPCAPALAGLPRSRRGLLGQVLQEAVEGAQCWLPKVEKVHAGCGVEFRTPFTDPALVRFSVRLPESFKIHGLRDKYILRRALLPLLPPRIANRPKFPQRMDYGLRLSEALDDLAARLLSPARLRERAFFDPAEIGALLRRPRGEPYRGNRAMRLWTAITTEIWAEIFLDGRGWERAARPYRAA